MTFETYEEKSTMHTHLLASAKYHDDLVKGIIDQGGMSFGNQKTVQDFKARAQEARDLAAKIFA